MGRTLHKRGAVQDSLLQSLYHLSHYVHSITLYFPTVDIAMYVSALWLSEAGLELHCIYT